MRLDARAFGLAAGCTAALLFVICALGVAIAPAATTAFAGMLIHADLTGITRTLTFTTLVGGLICWTIGTTLVFWTMGVVYNRLAGVKVGSGARVGQATAQRA
jgi:hypothetical protein